MDMEAGAEAAEARPFEARFERLALFGGSVGLEGEERPFAVPCGGRGGIDAPVGLGEGCSAGWGQVIEGLAAAGSRGQPALARQAVDAGPHQALRQPQRRHQADEAAEPDGAAARRHGVAEHGDDERAGTRLEAGEERRDASGALVGASMARRLSRSSLPPYGGGSGWGVRRRSGVWSFALSWEDPHPLPLPTGGRGAKGSVQEGAWAWPSGCRPRAWPCLRSGRLCRVRAPPARSRRR